MGAGTATVVGVLFGLVFAVVFARTRHRLPGVGDHARALWLAVIGFGVFVAMPALVIPANPPAVGEEGTVTERTLVYVLSILVALLVAGAVSALDRVLRVRGTTPPVRVSTVLAAGVVLVVVAVSAAAGQPGRDPRRRAGRPGVGLPAGLAGPAGHHVAGAGHGLRAAGHPGPVRARPATPRPAVRV